MANLIKTPHPVTLEGQERIAVDLRPGESLFSLLYRTMGADQLDGEIWNVTVGGVEVLREDWHNCYPKNGQLIEVVGDLGRSALMMVAVVALTIWTGGMFAAVAAGAGIAGMGAVASYAVIAGIQVAGSLLINKVLGPKPPGSPDNTQGPEAHSLNSTSNQLRQYGAVPILFGKQRFAPDLLSKTYSYFDRDDMYLAMHVAWGIGVGRVQNLRNGDTLLADYDENVKTWHTGFAAMPSQDVPLFGNTDSQPGGSLQQEKVPLEVVRTTSRDTVRIMVNISGSLYGVTRKGKLSMNQEGFEVSHRPAGSSIWTVAVARPIHNDDRRTLRFTIAVDVPAGQYDVRVRRTGQNSRGDGDVCEFSFDTMVSVQQDTSRYEGLARTGMTLRANERLSGQPTEINGEAVAAAIPVWYEDRGWVTEETDNVGACMLKFLRGYYDENGVLIAGVGATDEEIDIEAYKAFMVHCHNRKFGYNFWLAKDRDLLDQLNSMASAAMGQFTDANGLYSVVWVAEDQPVDGTINMARIKKGTFRVDYSLTGTADGVVARYWDEATNAEATLRVPMPGVQTMLSPATVTLEGVTNEEQAAILARYFLAQSLYQFKDVSFGVSLENLTFRRLSLLQVSHDMTQWGYSGVVVHAEATGGAVKLYLDEEVPPAAAGKQGWIGVRVPGQKAASVFKVKPFTEATKRIELAEPWPSDLPLPGNSDGNPAHDTIWIYDFKETPGLTARVTNVQRAVDRSATVSVVQESAEFWTYVNTGHYEPASSGSLLATRPTASALTVTEQQIVLGDVVQDQLVVSFEVSGPYDESRIYTVESDGSLRERARTNSRSAVFDISGPGTYTVMVVPYNRQGLRGVGVTRTYSTLTVGAPPVLVDTFIVEEVPGGLRRYTYGFHPDTIQSADFAGVEIRMLPGTVADPQWDAMEEVGAGFFTSSVELAVPKAGTYTFACRSRNTGGVLSEGMRIVHKTLRANLGEVIENVVSGVEQTQTDLAKEINDRIDDVNAARDKAAAELEAKATELGQDIDANAAAIRDNASKLQEQADDIRQNTDAIAQEVIDRVAGDLNTEVTLTTKIESETQQRESDVENLTRMISSISAGSGEQFDWAQDCMWYFDTTAEGWTGVYSPPTVVDGWLRPANTAQGQNTGIQSPAPLGVDGAAYRFIKLRMRRVGTPQWRGLLRWITEADRTWDDAKSATIEEPKWNANGIGNIEQQDLPWNSGSPIRAVRLALTDAQTDATYIAYDWISIGRPTPGASVAMVNEETQARITAVAAEATKRESLGVQMRGDYEGSDVAGVKTGLLGSEKTARIEGDAVLARDITALQSRMPEGSGKVASQADLTALRETNAGEHAAISQRIDTLNSQMGDKASAAALEALKTEVTRVDGKTDANAQSIVDLTATVNGVRAMGDNYALNGSFELGRDVGWGWGLAGTSVWSANEGRNGSACWKAGPQAGGAVRQVQANKGATIPVVPGQKYRIACYYRTEGFNGTPGQSKMRVGDQTGGYLIDFPFTGVNRPDWAYAERIYTVPTSGNVRALTAALWRDGDAGTLWVDDFTIENVTDFVANAEAVTGLTTKVIEVEDGVKANSESLTKLTSSIGNTVNYTVIASASITGSPSGAPKSSGVYRANGSVYPGLGFSRGIRVAQVGADNQFTGTQVFDTYGDAISNSKRFNDWYDALPDDSWFLLYTSDAVGNLSGGTNENIVGLRQRMMDAGMLESNSRKFDGFAMFAMLGRKGMGAGGAQQQLSREQSGNTRKGLWVSLQVSLMNGVPLSVGDGRYTDALATANATAITGLNTDVSSINGKIDAQAQQLTQLRTDVNDVSSKTAANTQAVQQLTTRTTAVEGKVETMGTTVTKLSSDMTTMIRGGDNLIQDGSFETRKPGDVYGVGRITDAYARTGTKSLSVTATGAIRDVSLIEFNSNGGRVYYCEVWVRNDPDAPLTVAGSGDMTVGLQCTVRRRNGTVSYPNVQVMPALNLTSTWVKLSGYVTVQDDVYSFIVRTTIRGGVTGGNVIYDDAYCVDVTDGYKAQQGVEANATAITGLTTRVGIAEGTVSAQAEQLTQLQTTLDSTFNRGDNLNANSLFDNTMEPFRKGNNSAVNGDVTWVSGAGQLGSAIQFIHKVGATGSPFVYANANRWSPLKAGKGRKMRTVVVARVVDGAATLTARCRVRTLGASGEGSNDQTTPNLTTAWQRFVLEHPVGDERTDAMSQVWVTNRGNTDCRVLVDRIEFYDITDEVAITGNAEAITGLNTKVTQQGTKLDATAQDLTQLKAQVGNVNATAFNQMQTTVQQHEGKISANATAIQGVQAGLGDKADAAVVVQMEATMKNLGESGNLLMNTTFPFRQKTGWGWGDNPGSGWLELGDNGAGVYDPTGMFGLGSRRPGALGQSGLGWFGTEYDIAVIPGKTYCASAYINTHRCDTLVEITFFKAGMVATGIVHSPWTGAVGAPPGGTLADMARPFVIAKAPAGTTHARFRVLVRGLSPAQGDPYFWMYRPMFSIVDDGATKPPAWSAGGTESSASWGVNVRADGKIGGIQLASNGVMSAFDVVADVFRVSAPGNGGQRTEYSDGHWRCYYPNGQLATRMGYWQ